MLAPTPIRLANIWAGLAALITLCGCNSIRPSAPDSLVTAYATAACVPLTPVPAEATPVRQWIATVSLRNGEEFSIDGAQIPGAAILVTDAKNGKAVFAANSGYNVSPRDVRFNAETSRLYVKTVGLAGGFSPTTELFEYDLAARQLLQQTDATKTKLLSECPDPVANSGIAR